MGKTKNATRPLTHEEIWDDSALVRSWDEAVEEYKLYHSIHARGENVDDVLREAEEAELAENQNQNQDQTDELHDDEDYTMQTGEEIPEVGPTVAEPLRAETEPTPGPASNTIPGVGPRTATTGPNPMPQALLSQVQDEGLKNLMMAWYFAGYYTGLYEGGQRASQNNTS